MKPFNYPEPPPLSVEPLGEVETYGSVSVTRDSRRTVAGWNELHQYGMMYHPIWAMAMRNAGYMQLSELDALKLLAGALLHQNVQFLNASINSAYTNPRPPTP